MRESREKDDSIETDLNLGTTLLLFWTRQGEVSKKCRVCKEKRNLTNKQTKN